MKLNTYQIKWIALIIMTLDHVASIFIPNNTIAYIILRGIGRISAPLFWFCFIEGYKHTRDKDKYKTRLLIASLVMFITNIIIDCYCQATPMDIDAMSPNMFLSFLCLSFIVDFTNLFKETRVIYKKILFAIPILALFCIVAPMIDYGFHMFAFGITFAILKNANLKLSIFAIISCVICLLTNNILQIFMVFSIFILRFYNDEKPMRSCKWFFYLYYPIHIYILILLYNILF